MESKLRGKHRQIPVHDAGGGGQIFLLIKFFPGLVTRARGEKFDHNIPHIYLWMTNSICFCLNGTWFGRIVEFFGGSAIPLVPNIHIRQLFKAITSRLMS